MPNGEHKNWVRLCFAIAGFRLTYGEWPTHVRIGQDYLDDVSSLFSPPLYRKLTRKLKFIVDGDGIIAEDERGRRYDYQGPPDQEPDIRPQDWLDVAPDSPEYENGDHYIVDQ